MRTILILLTLMSAVVQGARAGEPVKYIERSWDGTKVVETEKEVTDYTVLCGTGSNGEYEYQLQSDKWYVVKSSFGREFITVLSGNPVHLIVCDGATVSGTIYLKESAALYVYGQVHDTGKIKAQGWDHSEKFDPEGHNKETITGSYPAIGNFSKKGILVIHGGTINAHGINTTGIKGGDVVIYGGTVTAQGDDTKPGIGCNNFTMYGGTVTATADLKGSGIGGGTKGDGNTVNIYGGTLTAKGGNFAAGIGGGADGNGGTVNIYGGTVKAYGGKDGAGIGGGQDADGAKVVIDGGVVEAWAGNGSGTNAFGSNLSGTSHQGKMTFGDNMMVHAGSSPTSTSSFTSDLRTPACWSRKYVKQ